MRRLAAIAVIALMSVAANTVELHNSQATATSNSKLSVLPCTAAALAPGVASERSVTLSTRGHPRLTVRAYCGKQGGWFLGATIGREKETPYENDGDPPIGIAGVFNYSKTNLPVVLVEDSGCGSACAYKLFSLDDNKVKPIVLAHSYFSNGELGGGNAALHGEGISCAASAQHLLVVTQSLWYSNGVGEPKVSVTYQKWIVGGDPIKQVHYQHGPIQQMLFKTTRKFGQVRC